MKILSCYIANFGCIKNKEYKFNEHLNPFCEDNGQGKSTLAAFIKAMFCSVYLNYSFHYFKYSIGKPLVFFQTLNKLKAELLCRFSSSVFICIVYLCL